MTNAVLHAGSPARVRLEVAGDRAPVEVCDSSSALPRRRDPDDDVSAGRGLALVAVLATTWGVERHAGGKCVWAELGGVPAPRLS